jgi:hypothetical protein
MHCRQVIRFCPGHITVGESTVSTHQTAHWMLPRGDQNTIEKGKKSVAPTGNKNLTLYPQAYSEAKYVQLRCISTQKDSAVCNSHNLVSFNLSDGNTKNDFTHNPHHYLVLAMHSIIVTVYACSPSGSTLHFQY